MAGFFNSYIGELLSYNAAKVQQRPNDHDTIATHFALLQLNEYLKGTNKNTDFISPLENTAKLNNPFSLFLLGMLKLDGIGSVSSDQVPSYSLIALAALKKCYWALNVMGTFHMRGNSFVAKDLAAAKQNFTQVLAMMPGDKRALRNLGLCCLHRREHVEAMQHLKAAHKQGDNTLEAISKLLNHNKPKPTCLVAYDPSKVVDFRGPIMQQRVQSVISCAHATPALLRLL